MQEFKIHVGSVVPLDRANVDTDAIIPKQFLTSIRRVGFGQNLFDEWRYEDRGEPGQDCETRPIRPGFVLNLSRYRGSSILLTRANFGCGSSREHAAWALLQFGFRVIVAPSFGDIFHQNALKNGLLLVQLPERDIEELFQLSLGSDSALEMTVDLDAQTVQIGGSENSSPLHFHVDPSRKKCLLLGLDDVAVTLSEMEKISDFEQHHWSRFPWLQEETTALPA
ncbi:3-isopropylmalate dehydratase small subunit [Ottowia thiooxydans]|uniref:3-isopropylmalate dehydratase small subunit n=1 Tax=Ottowia thiooxydans TaxID=219182 RepID=UPI00040F3EE3|nr:3-isopropylmalate dehydratase small subunit [Ottowia thiooxydans]